MKTNEIKPQPSEHREQPSERIEFAGLDLAISILNRLRTEITSAVLNQLRSDISTNAPKLVVEEVERSGRVKELAAAEIAKRSKALFGWLGVGAAILALVGVTSVTPLVERIAQGRVEATSKDLESKVNVLEERISDAKVALAQQQATALQTLSSDITKEIRDAQRAIDKAVAEAKKSVEESAARSEANAKRTAEVSEEAIKKAGERALADLDRTASERKQELQVSASKATRDVNEAAESAVKNIRESSAAAIKSLTKAAVEKSNRGTGKPEEAVEKTVDAKTPGTDKNFEYLVATVDALDKRKFEEAFGPARKLADDEDERGQKALMFVFHNPGRYTAELLEVSRLVLAPHRSALERASAVTEVTVVAAIARATNLLNLVDEELRTNVIARIGWGNFDKFVYAHAKGVPTNELAKLFDAVDLDELTGVGLLNTLSLVKTAGLNESVLKDVERRVINSVTTTKIVDRASDYAVAWQLMHTLVSEPFYDVAGILGVAEHVAKYVFDKDHKDMDPWDLKTWLDQAKNLKPR